jgi:tetratricopeptide (TPR) repeat protein
VPLLLLAVLLVASPGWAGKTKKPKSPVQAVKQASETLVITTGSPEAKKLFESGLANYENLKTAQAASDWRAAVQKDRTFAAAYAYLTLVSEDPAELIDTRQKARALTSHVSSDEGLLITWLLSAQDNEFVTMIAAMNDLLQKYPKDKHLLYQAEVSYGQLGAPEQAVKMAERALAIDPNYGAALNNAAYSYADLRQFDRAIENLQQYARALPNEPNPEDSLGEIYRLAGKFDAALEHYQAALKIDPTFDSSQIGMADTYALMGEYEKAHAAYSKAIKMAPGEITRLDYMQRAAWLSIRKKDFGAADKALDQVAARAREKAMPAAEASALRVKASYQPDAAVSFELLDRAEKVLQDPKVSPGDRDTQLAYIFRDRVMRAAFVQKPELAATSMDQLQKLFETVRRSTVMSSYHIALAAKLISEKKNGEALEHLYEAPWNPIALQLQAIAFQNMKADAEADVARNKLVTVHDNLADGIYILRQ